MGTQRILRLAAVRGAHVHFVSTVGVAPRKLLCSGPDGKAAIQEQLLQGSLHCTDDAKGLGGYGASKLVSEALLAEATNSGRLSCAIYRCGFISACRKTGFANPSDFVCRLLRAFVENGEVPVLSEKWLDLSPLDWVAGSIAELVLKGFPAEVKSNSLKLGPEALLSVYHCISPAHEVPFAVLETGLRAAGYQLRPVTFEAWRDKAQHAGERSSILPLLHELGAHGRPRARHFDSSRCLAALVQANLDAPLPVGADDIRTCAAFLRRCGHMSTPSAGMSSM
eukprot:gnl/TRDRNA2_/TRDRNA2_132100_c2_seq1.p1 gnl/TRDRNA2_/TRDRNA2_132100_c2~~gnl/TRDRNA2_/TRDRNA2_132100_c2_seq1.p1  ORF type:complete len:281 (-),score=42.39 gnl/TRDRNA2_/TRDRNA2_132100_c2_seq1:7-849(-)